MTQLNLTSLNSDKDYLKIFDDGSITISADSTPDADSTSPADPGAPFGLSGSTTITHNLGQVPLVRAFWDPAKNGTWHSVRATDPWMKVIATTTYVKLIMNTDGGAKTNIPVFYRIYELGTKSVTSEERIDKIFAKNQTTVTATAAGSSATPTTTTSTITHTGGEAPIWNMQFSEDGSNWYPEGSQIVGAFDLTSGPPGGPYSFYYYTSARLTATSSSVTITVTNNYSTAKTIYVRYTLDYKE